MNWTSLQLSCTQLLFLMMRHLEKFDHTHDVCLQLVPSVEADVGIPGMTWWSRMNSGHPKKALSRIGST